MSWQDLVNIAMGRSNDLNQDLYSAASGNAQEFNDPIPPSIETFGAVGYYREGRPISPFNAVDTSLTIASGSKVPTFNGSGGLTAADIGRTIMIAGAIDSTVAGVPSDLVTTIESDGAGGVRLKDAATIAATNTRWHVCVDDSAAFELAARTGNGFTIPDNGKTYVDQRPGHMYPDDFWIHFAGSGRYVIGNYPTSFWHDQTPGRRPDGQGGFNGRGHAWHSLNYTAVHNVDPQPERFKRFRMTGRGAGPHIQMGAGHGDKNPLRSIKMFCVSWTNNAYISGIKYFNQDAGAKLFCLSIENCNNGVVDDCEIINIYTGDTGGQGADALHFLGNCDNWTIRNNILVSADDSSSQTQEEPVARSVGCTIRNITYLNNVLLNVGHAGIKTVIGVPGVTPLVATIENIAYIGNRIVTWAPGGAAGALDHNGYGLGGNTSGIAVVVQNTQRAGTLRNISIINNTIESLWPGVPSGLTNTFKGYVLQPNTPVVPQNTNDSLMTFDGVDNITISGNTFRDWNRAVFNFTNCNNFTVTGNTRSYQSGITFLNGNNPQRAVFRITACTNYSLQPEGSGLVKSFPTQDYTLIA